MLEEFVNNHKKIMEQAYSKNPYHTMVVNAYGGAGAGKSTACYHIVAELKKRGYVAEYVSEYAKDLVWDENFSMLDGSFNNQFDVLKEQLHRVDRLIGKVDFVVTDSPILLNYTYLKAKTNEYKEMIKELNSHFDSFNFEVKRNPNNFEQEGRIHTLEESMAKDKEISSMLKEFDVYCGTYTHQQLNTVVNNICVAKKNLLKRQKENDVMNENSKGIKVVNDNGAVYEDTYYVIEKSNYNGQDLFLCESEVDGEDSPAVILDENANVILEDVYNGFSDYEERREDLVQNYALRDPISFTAENGVHVRIGNYYTLPHELKFVDETNKEYQLYLGTFDTSDIKLIVKTDNEYLYSGKLDEQYTNGEINLTDPIKLEDYSFNKLASEEQLDRGNENFYKFFYSYENKEAEEFRKSNDYKKFLGGDEQGLNGDTYVVYREIGDLPKYLREYAKQQVEIENSNIYNNFARYSQNNLPNAYSKEDVQEIFEHHMTESVQNLVDTLYTAYQNSADNYLEYQQFKAFAEANDDRIKQPFLSACANMNINTAEIIKAGETKKPVAIECTSDYSDDTFRTNMNNTKGFGKEEYYRLVTVNEKGFVVPIDDKIYPAENEARAFINRDRYEHIKYDDMIYLAAKIQKDKLYDNPHREDVTDIDKPYTPSSEELTIDEQKKEAILQGVGAVMNSEGFANYADTMNKLMLNKFSPRNCGLILNQYIGRYCDENKIDVLKLSSREMTDVIKQALESEKVPTYLMGYEAWKDYGRQVAKDKSAYQIVAPNYVTEYNGKGTIIRAMEKKFKDDFAKNKDIQYSEFKLGKTGLTFRGYGENGKYLVDVCSNGNTIIGKQTIEEIRKYLDNEIIGKMPNGYSTTFVYDVKDTVVPEHLWVKSNFSKTELVTDEQGNPVTRPAYKNSKIQEFKILNSEERTSKFKPELEMTVTGLTEEKAQVLFETLQSLSLKKNIPMEIETIKGEARGYFHPQEKRIAISDKLDIVSKCATAIHEMAHADLHSTPSTKGRDVKELEAEAVSYITSKNYGINTDVKSFNYLASWSKGRDLKDLEASMSVILKESKKLETEIAKELESRGYNLCLDKINSSKNKDIAVSEKAPALNQETEVEKKVETKEHHYVPTYKEFVIIEQSDVDLNKTFAKSMYETAADERASNILKEQMDILNKMNRKLVTIDNNINALKEASSQKEVDKLTGRIDKYFMDYAELKNKFSALSNEYMEHLQARAKEEKATFRDNYKVDPINALKDYIAKSDNEQFKALSDKEIAYIAKSDYLNSTYSKMIASDTDKFINKGIERFDAISDVKSKNGQFIEVVWCEQWFDKPIVKEGALIHPATANKIFGEAEKDIRKLKEIAEKEDEYVPYSKCKFTVFTETKDSMLATTTRMDVGDGYQSDLTSFLTEACNNEIVMEAYSKSVKERVKDKIYEPSAETKIEVKQSAETKTADDNKGFISLDDMKNFVSPAQEHDSPNADHQKQRQHDRGSMSK